MMGVLLWTILWWVPETLPIEVTALLPLLLLPSAGVLSATTVSQAYFSDTNVLIAMMGIFALAFQQAQIDTRIALFVLLKSNGSIYRTVAVLLFTVYLLSWFMSNTATAATFMPMGVKLVDMLTEQHRASAVRNSAAGVIALPAAKSLGKSNSMLRFLVPIMIAYASSVGGMATTTGTPTNIVLVETYAELNPTAMPIGYTSFLAVGVPTSLVISLLLLGAVWFALWRSAPPGGHQFPDGAFDEWREQQRRLGPLPQDGLMTIVIFVLLVLGWATMDGFGDAWPGWRPYTQPTAVAPGTLAVGATLLLFILPRTWSGPTGGFLGDGPRLLHKSAVKEAGWPVILLLGGGSALSKGIQSSGLASSIAVQLGAAVRGAPPIAVVLLVAFVNTFATELVSNTAAAQITLPIYHSVAQELGIDSLRLLLPATFACSLAFMLPTASPPNAIAYNTGYMTIGQMATFGFLLNIFGALLAAALSEGLGGTLSRPQASPPPSPNSTCLNATFGYNASSC